MFRVARIAEYLGMLVGRTQNLIDIGVRIASTDEMPVTLKVHWSMPPRRDSSAGSQKPGSFDILLDAVRHPQEFERVLERWIERQAEWHDARYRFFNSFSRQRYDIDRLIGSANMFDILPKSAVPFDVPIGNDLKSAQSTARDLFRALPQSPERNSILSALGRIGESNLKHKVRHRAQRLVAAVPEWFPDLFMVTDEAVNCRNHYVHGGPPRFDYNGNFAAVVFFTETLEFVFGASDLIDAGWDIRSWILQGTTMSHPFGRYRANYSLALANLRSLLPTASTLS